MNDLLVILADAPVQLGPGYTFLLNKYGIIFAIVGIVAFIAHGDNRNEWLWGGLTLGLCLGAKSAFPEWGTISAGAVMVAVILLMFIANCMRNTL